MATLQELVVKIRGDLSGLDAALKGVDEKLKGTERRTRKTTAMMSAAFTRVQHVLTGVITRLSALAGRMKYVALIGGGMFLLSIKNAIDYAVSIDKANKATGLATETLSKLAYVAEQEHASFDTITKSIGQLARVMVYVADSPTNEYSRAMKEMRVDGLGAADSGRTLLDVLMDISEYVKTANPDKALGLVRTVLGRRGMEMMPFLKLGREEMARLMVEAEELGLVLDPGTTRAAKRLDDQLVKLKRSATGLSIAMLDEMMPALTAFTEMASGSLIGADVAWLAQMLSESIGGLISLWSLIKRGWTGLFSIIRMTAGDFYDYLGVVFENVKRIWSKLVYEMRVKWISMITSLVDAWNKVAPWGMAIEYPKPTDKEEHLPWELLHEKNRWAFAALKELQEKQWREFRASGKVEMLKWQKEMQDFWDTIRNRGLSEAGHFGPPSVSQPELGGGKVGQGEQINVVLAGLQMELQVQGLINQANQIYVDDLGKALNIAQAITGVYKEWLAAETDPARREMLEKQLELIRLQLQLAAAGGEGASNFTPGQPPSAQPTPPSGGVMEDVLKQFSEDQPAMADRIVGVMNQAVSSISGAIAGVITGTTKMKDALKQIGTQILSSILNNVLSVLAAMLLELILNNILHPVPGSSKGGITRGTGMRILHDNELIAPMNTVQRLFKGIMGHSPEMAFAGGGSMGGGGMSVGVLNINAELNDDYDTRSMIETLSDAVDAEMGRTNIL